MKILKDLALTLNLKIDGRPIGATRPDPAVQYAGHQIPQKLAVRLEENLSELNGQMHMYAALWALAGGNAPWNVRSQEIKLRMDQTAEIIAGTLGQLGSSREEALAETRERFNGALDAAGAHVGQMGQILLAQIVNETDQQLNVVNAILTGEHPAVVANKLLQEFHLRTAEIFPSSKTSKI